MATKINFTKAAIDTVTLPEPGKRNDYQESRWVIRSSLQ